MHASLIVAKAVLALLTLPGVHQAEGLLQAEANSPNVTSLTEYYTAVESDGSFKIHRGDEATAIIHTDAQTVLVMHTHPDCYLPQPSPQDIAEAARTGIPDIVVSRYAEYVVMPDGSVTEVR
jgi:proteasome lid subunit RPN8/RPN11